MRTNIYSLTTDLINKYVHYLEDQERSAATIQKYTHDLRELMIYAGEAQLTKALMISWKNHLAEIYALSTANTMIAAVNGFFVFMNWRELSIKQFKIQKSPFLKEEKELTRQEYIRMVQAAERNTNERLSLVIQTICATGIRVSELRFITVEAVQSGRAEVSNKGKRRTVFLQAKLCKLLRKYIQKQKKTAGPVFTTKTGKPLDRSNIWRDMKALCESANVNPEKVFPHNLRHLFARTYYSLEHDLSRLADILGHSNINTTRIYTAESGAVHARQMERMALIVT